MTLKVFILKFTARVFHLMDSYMVELMKTQKELNFHIRHAFLPKDSSQTIWVAWYYIPIINCRPTIYLIILKFSRSVVDFRLIHSSTSGDNESRI